VERVALQDDRRTLVYTKKNCPFCQLAKEELKLRGIPYDSIDIEDAGKTAAEITGRRDVKTVPQIYVEGEYIGGYDDLMKWLSGGTVQSEEGEECRACEG
jgi:glutaredoxin